MGLGICLVAWSCLLTVLADNANHAHYGDVDHHPPHHQHQPGLSNRLSFGNNNAGGGGGGYGAPSGGYGAPAGDYGAPASGYGAPATGYGGGGGGYDAPVYVQTTAGGGLGGLLGLLPLGALALAIPLGLLALTLPVTTTLIGGRKKRGASEDIMTGNMSLVERQAELLRTYLDTHGLDHDTALQRDMIARYLECGSEGASGLVTECLERLTCLTHDGKVHLPARDREVAAIILETILENEFLTAAYKKRLLEAGQTGHDYPGSCHKYRCDQEVFGLTKPMKYKKLSETLSSKLRA